MIRKKKYHSSQKHQTIWLAPRLPEAGTYTGHIEIMQTDKPVAFFDIPQDAAGKELHIICEVMDNGSPALTGYRRVIIRPVD